MGAAGFGRIYVAKPVEPKILGHRKAANPGRIARAEKTIDIGDRQTRIHQRAVHNIGMESGARHPICEAGWMLKHARDKDLLHINPLSCPDKQDRLHYRILWAIHFIIQSAI